MSMNKSSSGHDDDRVVPLRRSQAPHPPAPSPAPADDDLRRFEQEDAESAEAYRHRMKVNLAAFAFVLVLIGAAFWMADAIFTMRKNQDCVLTGRRSCAPVDYTPQAR
jgi:hypothetical protein